MKTSFFVLTSPHRIAWFVLGLCSSGACAQPGGRDSLPTIAAPVVQQVAPLGVKEATPPTIVGIEQIGRGEVAPVAVNASAYRVAAAIKKLRTGEMTPQQVWDGKALDIDDLIYFLEKGLDSWGGFFWEKDPKLRRALVALLIEHGGEKLKKPEELAPTVRLWLADYYGDIGDERVLSLSESVLSEMKAPLKGENALAFQSVERIAWFYRDTKQFEKAVQTWLRMKTYHSEDGWWQADALIEAARMSYQGGKPKEALQFYAQAGLSPDASHAGGAILEGFGRELQRNPKQTELRLLQIEKEAMVPDARLASQFLLTWAKYKAQDWKGFLKYSEQILHTYELIEDRSRRKNFARLAFNVEEAQKWANLWLKQTVVAENSDLDLVFRGPILQTIERRIFVNTPVSTQLKVAVVGDTQRVQARLEESPWAAGLENIRHQQVVVITITDGPPEIQALIRIECVQQPFEPLILKLMVSSKELNFASRN